MIFEDNSGSRREFGVELEKLINKYSMENNSNTPDFILAEYLTFCLHAFDKATNQRHEWFVSNPSRIIEKCDPHSPIRIDLGNTRKDREESK